jgi:hypothetical protein
MAVAALALVVMAGVQLSRGFDDGYPFQVDAAYVSSRPDASLFYPGSERLQHSAQGEQDHPLAMSNASIPAASTTYLAVDASPDQVLGWYRQQLRGQGWDDTTDPTRTSRPHADFARGTREFVHVDVFGRAPAGLAYTGSGQVYAFQYGINARY